MGNATLSKTSKLSGPRRKRLVGFSIVTTILLILANPLSSQAAIANDVLQVSSHPWSKLDWVGNAKWSTIDVSGNGQVIAATTEEGGLFISNDSGENWRPIFEVGFTDVFDAEVSEDGRQISASGDRIVFHSYDEGFTWSAIPRNGSAPNRCKYIYSCGTETTFEFVKVRGHPSGLLFAPGAIVVDGKFRYLAGRNWNWVSASVSADKKIIIATAWQWTLPGPDLATFISKDSGKTFTNATSFPRAIFAEVSADGTTLVLASDVGRIHVSKDLGSTWRSESSPSETQVYFTSNLEGTKLFALAPRYAGESSLLFSANSGMSWERIQVQGAVNYLDISCNEDCSTVMLQTSDANGMIRTLKSIDAGVNWTSLANVPIGLDGARFAISNDGNFIVGTTYSEIFLSRDGGLTWLKTNSTKQGCLYRPIFYSSSDTLLIFNCAGEALRSVNFGVTWESLTFPQSHITSIASGQGIIAASTTNAVYTSSDIGNSWQSRLTSPTYPNPILFGNVAISSNGRVIAVEQAGPLVLVSKDAGLNWSSLTDFSNKSELGLSREGNGKTYGIWLNRDGSQVILSRQKGGSWLYSPVPILLGSGVVGTSLSVNPGSWDSGVTLSYQWLKNGAPIVGRAGSEYLVTASDFGSSISVRVSGNKAGHLPASQNSLAVSVTPMVMKNQAKPKMSGVAKVGNTLKATTSKWAPSAQITYNWTLDGRQISGANRQTLKLLPSYKKKLVSVVVTQSCQGCKVAKQTAVSVRVS
jgi:photosystem II stability/assembly factor-like uncharacterized protein